MQETWLKKLAAWHVHHPWRMVGVVLLLTVILGSLASQLSVTLRWSDLLPTGDKRTIEYNQIVEEFVSATSIVVVVQGEEDRMKAFADDLAPRLKSLTLPTDSVPFPLIQRVDYKSEADFLKDHSLMLMKKDDLENAQDMFTDPNLSGLIGNINDALEKEYVGKEESLSDRQKEDQAIMSLDGIAALVQLLNKASTEKIPEAEVQKVVDKMLLGEPYILSYDKTALVLNAIPNFTIMDLNVVIDGVEKIQEEVDLLLQSHPDVRAGLTGFMPLCRDEMHYSEQSLGVTTLIAVAAIFILLVISFRMWIAPFFALSNLLIGILWAVGIVAVTVGQLNIMTQMMAVILLGLGIDFSIHLISGFTEFRSKGMAVQQALEETFVKIGRGVITGGLTTSFAFLSMVISSSRGMKEMGLVTGLGLLAILLATFLVLPIFMLIRERIEVKKQKRKGIALSTKDLSFQFLGNIGSSLGKHPGLTFVIALLLTAGMFSIASQITFDQNYMNIEPEGLTTILLQDTILHKFDLSMDYAMVLSDTPEESFALAKTIRKLPSIAMVEDIGLYLPPSFEQKERMPLVEKIYKTMKNQKIRRTFTSHNLDILKKEVDRLQMNVMEIQDMAYLGGQDKVENKCSELVGDPDMASVSIIQALLETLENTSARQYVKLQQTFAPMYQAGVLSMANTEKIQMKDLPASILDRYSNKDRSQFLLTAYPSGNIWKDAEFLKRFVTDLERETDRATGMPPVFLALIDIIGRDGRISMLLTVCVVFVLLLIDFRNAKYALMAMVPLITGLIWMVGLMKLTGQQFTVMNVMGLPMILGIGIDDGVHVVHRWIAEGKTNLKTVFASTGKAILLTSLTTMLGFGSLIFSVWRGFGHLGAALFVGVAACFITTILFLPAVLGWMKK